VGGLPKRGNYIWIIILPFGVTKSKDVGDWGESGPGSTRIARIKICLFASVLS